MPLGTVAVTVGYFITVVDAVPAPVVVADTVHVIVSVSKVVVVVVGVIPRSESMIVSEALIVSEAVVLSVVVVVSEVVVASVMAEAPGNEIPSAELVCRTRHVKVG